MGDSYWRRCNVCGQRIQMRKMKHNWVAFDDYDTVHEHNKKKSGGTAYTPPKNEKPNKEKEKIPDFEFPKISVGGGFSPSAGGKPIEVQKPPIIQKPPVVPIPPFEQKPHVDPIPETYKPPFPKQESHSLSKQISNQALGFIIIVIIILLAIIFCRSTLYSNTQSSSSRNNVGNPPTNYSGNAIATPILSHTNIPKTNPTKTLASKTDSISTQLGEVKSQIRACVVDYSSIGIRECPSTNYNTTEYLLKGQCVDVSGRERTNTWVFIKAAGWINSFYVEIDGEIEKLPIVKCTIP